MGTPNRKYRAPELEQVIERPSAGEYVSAVEVGRKVYTSKRPDREIGLVLEEVKNILLPLVPHMGKELEYIDGFRTEIFELAPVFRRKRAMQVFSVSPSFPRLALGRNGDWYFIDDGRFYHGTSTTMAMAIKDSINVMVEEAVGRQDRGLRVLMSSMPELQSLARLRMMSWFIEKIVESSKKKIKEREEKLQVMRSRVELLDALSNTVDPLLARRKVIKLPHFNIHEEHDRGDRNCSGSYLAVSAMKPSLETIPLRKDKKENGYYLYEGARDCDSIESFFFYVRIIAEEVHKYDHHQDTARSIVGSIERRLPLNDEERAILQMAAIDILQTK